jgi:hypothetical protein
MTGKPLGPFETEALARAAAMAAAEPGLLPVKPVENRRLLGRVCQVAGLAMGRYDDRIAEWLSIWEPSTVAVVAGWISRANRDETAVTVTTAQAAVVAKALEDAEGYRRLRADQWCGNCEAAPQGACDDHLNDLDLADAYRDLAAELASVLPQQRGGGRDA